MRTENTAFKRDQMVGTYITVAEKKLVQRIAREMSLTMSELLRAMLLACLTKLQTETDDNKA